MEHDEKIALRLLCDCGIALLGQENWRKPRLAMDAGELSIVGCRVGRRLVAKGLASPVLGDAAVFGHRIEITALGREAIELLGPPGLKIPIP